MRPFTADGAFDAKPNLDGLRAVAVRGVGVAMSSQAFALALQLTSGAVLARLLGPSDFGVVAMVTTFSLLPMNFGLNGFTEAVIQREELDDQLASNLFWINLLVGLVLTAAFAASGTLMARLYGEPRVAPVALALSTTILLTSLSVQHLALLRRAACFSAIAANDVASRAVFVFVSIGLSLASWGYWALVAGNVAQVFASCAGAWWQCRWVPVRPRRHQGTGAMVRFALNTYGFFIAYYVRRNIDNLIVGLFAGPQSLGLYKKAYDLSVLPVGQLGGPLNTVALPTLSRLVDDPARFRRYVIRATAVLSFVGMGVATCLALTARDLVFIMLGPRWTESARIFSYFAPGIGAMLIYMTYSFIHLSMGRAGHLLRWGIVEVTVMTSLFFIGIHWGSVGVAAGWTVGSWLLLLPALSFAGRPVGLRARQIAGAIWRYMAAAGLAGAATAFLVAQLAPAGEAANVLTAFARSASSSVLFLAIYVGLVVALHGSTAPVSELLELLREGLPRRLSKYLGREPQVTAQVVS